MEANATLHCPDYTEDVTLRKAVQSPEKAISEEG
jgi:hypothetical protein